MTPEEIQQVLKRKYPPTGKFSFINDVWLHYVELVPDNYNKAHHKTIVMIHGLSGSVNDFLMSPMMTQLKGKFRIICIDRPGAGYSYITNEKQYTLEDQIEVVKILLQQLNVENPIIVGHSLGGALVMNFATLNPDYHAKYLLLAPLLYPVWLMYFPLLFLLNVKWVRWIVFRIILIIQTVFFHQLLRNAFRPNADLLHADYEAITKDQLSSWIQLKAEFNNLRTVRYTLEKNSVLYNGVTRPLSILVGKHDKIIPAAYQAEKLSDENPNISLKCFPRVGHMVNFACAEEIVEEIVALSR